MLKPIINPEYNVLTLVNLLSTAMHGDLNTDQWEQYFSFDAKMLDEIQNALQTMNDWHAVDNAQGTTLDLLGNDFGVARNGDNDDMYRFKIKAKRWIRLSDGTCNAIYRMVANALSLDPSEFYIHANDLPNQVVIDNIPADKINDNEKIKWLVEQAENAVAYGIKIADIVFETNSFGNYNVFTGYQCEEEVSNVFRQDFGAFTESMSYYGSTFSYEDTVVNVTKLANNITNYGNYNIGSSFTTISEVTNISKNIKERDQ